MMKTLKMILANPKNPRLADRQARETGQALVLVAFLIIGLIAITGLVVDGGQLFVLQRRAQNATDAALLAALHARCIGEDATTQESAGLAAASVNGFDDNGGTNTVSVDTSDPDEIQVDVWGKTNPYFIQLVYSGPLQVTTKAVGNCKPATIEVAFANFSFVGLNNDPNVTGVTFTGNSDMVWCNGGVHTNSTRTSSSGAGTATNNAEGSTGPSPSIHTEDSCADPTFSASGDWSAGSAANLSPYTVSDQQPQISDPFAENDISPPANPGSCVSSPGSGIVDLTTFTNSTVCYTSLECSPNATVEYVGPGIIYVQNGVDLKCNFTANNVLIYVASGAWGSNSGAFVHITARSDGGSDYDGLAVWMAGTAPSDDFSISAQSNGYYRGTFYMPNADAGINGGASSIFIAQFIAYTINFSGSAGTYIEYNDDYFFHYEDPATLYVTG